MKITSIILALVGCVLTSGILENNTSMHCTWIGILVGGAGAVFYALYSVFSEIGMKKDYPALTITFYSMVDFQNRKREFGLLEAVGTTRQQLKAMLDREMGIYLGGSLVIALVFGSILSVIVCRRLDAVNHCITLVLPWLFLLALVVVLAVIYLIFTAYAKSELKKTSILSAIREE